MDHHSNHTAIEKHQVFRIQATSFEVSITPLKMKFTLATVLPFLAVTSAASFEVRQSNPVTVALSNDQSGAQAGVTLQADGTDKTIPSLFGSTSVGAGGTVKASSVQLTAFPQSINCAITNNGAILARLTAQTTYVDLDGNPGASVPINLNNAVINCRV